MHVFPEILPIREASRQMVRGLGVLDPVPLLGLPFSQCHALIEIERAGATTVAGLASALLLDPSVASRIVSVLEREGWVAANPDPSDGRKKLISLTSAGLERMKDIHEASNGPVLAALKLLAPRDREKVLEGLELYGSALIKASHGKDLAIREIAPEDDAQVAQLIKTVMTEIGACGPGFSINDPEVLAMSKNYSRPKAAFFVLTRGRQVIGCAGFAHLIGGPDDVCELRKMYFYPEARGLGKAQEMLTLILAEAKQADYRTMYLETLNHLGKALELYRRNGFTPIEGPMGNTGHGSCDTFYAREL